MFFDTHAHYNDAAFDADREELLSSLPANGIDRVINVGDTLLSSETSVTYAETYPYIYAAVGVHPEHADTLESRTLRALEKMATHKKVVAVGEIGLDYHYDDVPREVQRTAFRQQLLLAARVNLPVIIHDREAHGDCLKILQETPGVRGVMHCFSGSVEFMREVVRLGMYVALGGVVTYKNAAKTPEVAKEVPLDKLLLETDCPYLSPVPHRGKRNSSLYLPHTAEKIAEIRGISVEELAARTSENAKYLFGIN